jgi:ubiquinone/menaquinone biosynthesis C-methylase UbiE
MREELYHKWKADEQAPSAGWDFSYLKGRMVEEKPPWNYVEVARKLVQTSTAVLDMATGGGEVFSQLAPFPKHTVAVEGWPPNVEVARKRLTPLGVQVVDSGALTGLPFADETFDFLFPMLAQ